MQGHKLTVLVAKNAPIALILRRGPTKWYHLVKLNLQTNECEHGTWFRGRLYEDFCDISYDGQYFLYKAFKGSNFGTSYEDSYTGLSSLPWMKAHWLLPIGSTYEGGGYFVDEKNIGIYRLGFVPLNPHPDHIDSRGFTILHASAYNQSTDNCIVYKHSHADEQVVANSDWSKTLADGSVIWHKGYELYRRYADKETKLIADLSDLKPNRRKAPY